MAKPKSMFSTKEEHEVSDKHETNLPHGQHEAVEHEEHLRGMTEHPEEDATGAPLHDHSETPIHPALKIIMNKLMEPEEEEPLMPHHVGGIKKR